MEGNVLFNDTFIYGYMALDIIMVKDHSYISQATLSD